MLRGIFYLYYMATILALDTSTEACSCAISSNGEISEKYEFIPREHTRYLLPMIKSLMAECGLRFSSLDGVAVGSGPGSFTGLRIAAGVAQGIAYGADLPLIPVSTLAAMAQQSKETNSKAILTCLDARISEVYWAVYTTDKKWVELVGEEHLCKPELLDCNLKEACYAVGNGMVFIEQMPLQTRKLIEGFETNVYPRASAIAELGVRYLELGLSINPADYSPTYLRNQVTQN